MKKIAVLLTVFNRRLKTLKCLELLKNQVFDDKEQYLDIYLTDDGCTDGTFEAVTTNYPYVNIIKGDGNLYWNHGMLEAWKAASINDYDFYIWINDDVELQIDAINRLLNESAKHNDKAIVGGSMCATNDSSLITYGGRISRHKLIQNVNYAQKCKTLSGNLVLIPRFVFLKIGMNDPYYKHSMGDLDYTLRANEDGIEVWIAKGVYGTCDREDGLPAWANTQNSICKRFSHLYSVRGNNPIMEFYFNKRHYGIVNALYRFMLSHIHVLIPQIWDIKLWK